MTRNIVYKNLMQRMNPGPQNFQGPLSVRDSLRICTPLPLCLKLLEALDKIFQEPQIWPKGTSC